MLILRTFAYFFSNCAHTAYSYAVLYFVVSRLDRDPFGRMRFIGQLHLLLFQWYLDICVPEVLHQTKMKHNKTQTIYIACFVSSSNVCYHVAGPGIDTGF